MRHVAKIVIVSAVAIAFISVALTVFIPTHTGEIRSDLRIGDYYVVMQSNPIGATTFLTEERITGFTEDGMLVITRTSDGEVTEGILMTKDYFLSMILLKRDGTRYETVGYATLETGFGSRYCTIYHNYSTEYWVGEHDIIYKQSTHGYNSVLKETSLIIR